MKLNVATRYDHADVDEPWLSLLKPTISRGAYLNQLVRMFGFVAPFESACKYTPALSAVVDLVQYTRAGLIAQDLLSLGLSASQVASIPQCQAITTFRSVPEAMGWIYVVERTTMLQHGIRRHLLEHLPEVDHACSYLAAYEQRVTEQWPVFGRLLDRVGAQPEVAIEVVDAARTGFDTVKRWLRGAAD